MHRRFCIAVVLASLAALAACTSDTGPAGARPTVANLTADPTSFASGEARQITLTFDVSDADADVQCYALDVTLDGRVVASVGKSPIAGVAGQPASRVTALLLLQAPAPGTYGLVLRVFDAEGSASDPVSVDLVAN